MRSRSAGGDADTDSDTGSSECVDWYACQNCGGEACIDQIASCAGDSACGMALNAWAACVKACDDPQTCADEYAADGGAYGESLRTCSETYCADECGL